MLKEKCKNYIEVTSSIKLTEDMITKIERHMNRYGLYRICAYYEDWEDFCSDWCDQIGYTRTEARQRLHGGEGEFQIIQDLGILRYT